MLTLFLRISFKNCPFFPYRKDPYEAMQQDLFDIFKFRSYAPLVFSRIRRLFGVNRTDFVESLCGDAHFIEFLSNSNSGMVRILPSYQMASLEEILRRNL